MANERFRNYFIANGQKYYTGTIFVTEHSNYPLSGTTLVEATFICYDTEQQRYIYKKKIPHHDIQTNFATEKSFYQEIKYLTDRVDSSACLPAKRYVADTNVKGMSLGWTVYIFLMIIGAVSKNALSSWIVISIAFFLWRKSKLNREGSYIEW